MGFWQRDFVASPLLRQCSRTTWPSRRECCTLAVMFDWYTFIQLKSRLLPCFSFKCCQILVFVFGFALKWFGNF